MAPNLEYTAAARICRQIIARLFPQMVYRKTVLSSSGKKYEMQVYASMTRVSGILQWPPSRFRKRTLSRDTPKSIGNSELSH